MNHNCLVSVAHCSVFPSPLQVLNQTVLSVWIRKCNDLTAASNKWHVEGNLWRYSSITDWNLDVRWSYVSYSEHLNFPFYFLQDYNPVILILELQAEIFPEDLLTHFTREASWNCSHCWLNHCMKLIQRVSAQSLTLCETLPFSLCVAEHSISLGYPPQDSKKNTSWCRPGQIVLLTRVHDARWILTWCP